MNRYVVTVVALCFPFFLSSQVESRLALVVGNSAYDEGALQNPVNDANLVAETLRDLNFDVILGTDIRSKQEFVQLIRDFGSKREDYDVALVYYAGHGVQIGAENFLLPTGEIFESDFDVIDYGVSVQNILRYLNSVTDKVNVLILDACRNNPFEQKWSPERSIVKGQGLAKMSPPTGSLIAFSTEAGSTAPDGNENNSWYCLSLCRNMRLRDTSLDQVFRNVRKEVLEATSGNQRPIEASQLTGSAYFLNKGSDEELLRRIDSLLLVSSYSEAENLVDAFLMFNSQDHRFLTKKGHIVLLKSAGSKESALSYYQQALIVEPSYMEAIKSIIYFENTDEDLGLLVCVDGDSAETLTAEYIERNPGCFDLLLCQARYNFFADDSVRIVLGVEQLLRLRELVDEGSVDFDCSVEIGQKDSDVGMTLDNNMMYAMEACGEWGAVLSWAEVCQKNRKADAWAFHMMGRAYYQLIPSMVDSSEMVKGGRAMAKAYLKGLRFMEKDKRLYYVLAAEIVSDILNTFYGLSLLEDEVVDQVLVLGDRIVGEISDDYNVHSGGLRNFIRQELALAEILRGEYFRGLKHTSQALSEYEFLQEFPWRMQGPLEIEVLAYAELEEWDLFCESIDFLLRRIEVDGGAYGEIWSEEELIDWQKLNCD